MNLNFNKVWASDTSPDYPSDTQAKRGLSYLGTEPPTFDLHDAIFQRLDSKALWLYDQVRVACERFGQKVQNDDGSLVSDARDIMANAITYALLNQRKADEGGYGIVRMANYEQAQAGKEYNLAVSPAHLKEFMDSNNTWENTKDKPQTATRWPDYSEVKNTPSLGTASSKNVEYFEKNGEAAKAVENRVIRDGITIAGVRSDDGSFSPYVRKDSGGVVNLATESALLTLNAGLSRIARTGNVADSTGSIPWDRVGDKPRWTNNVYTGDGDTVVTSSSGTGRLLVNDEWINFYPSQKGSCFSVGPDGRIYDAKINHDQVLGLHAVAVSGNYGDLNDKPILADSTNKPMRYGADVPSYKDLKYEDDRIPSVSIVAQLRDGLIGVINALENSLASVSKSGSYDDLTNKPFLGDAAVKGVIYGTQDPNDAGWDDGKVASGAYVKRVMQYYLETYAIGSYMYCQPVSNTNELVPGDIVDGQYLRPSSGNKVGGLGGLPGQWKCKGYSVNSGVAALERVTLFQRFS